ncbi:hypothetical protein [Streptomyces alboniger]|uniref:LPXTG cell wall anchor domain-containing protein n=1 Tax=Streptomyces alboniger TaxID=132473 RepID=A0A5J6HTB4_STRAD|nr:hypothetical protein [Streptomyces alboniger]QEV20237.1 hypothetical protein CP975_24305 [Streptomyces alboniger]
MSTHRQALLRTAALSALVGGALLAPAAVALADTPARESTATATATRPAAEPYDVYDVYDVTLGNGAKAEVRHRDSSYVATISVKGEQIATLSARHSTVTESGVRYELYPSNGHIGITHLKGGSGAGPGTPRGGVEAGAEGVRGTGDPAFLVAGGAMAAAGAAGLGFAMLRRGRTDS